MPPPSEEEGWQRPQPFDAEPPVPGTGQFFANPPAPDTGKPEQDGRATEAVPIVEASQDWPEMALTDERLVRIIANTIKKKRNFRTWIARWPGREAAILAFAEWGSNWEAEIDEHGADVGKLVRLYQDELPEPPPHPGHPNGLSHLGPAEIDALIAEGAQVLVGQKRALDEDPRLQELQARQQAFCQSSDQVWEVKKGALMAKGIAPESPEFHAAWMARWDDEAPIYDTLMAQLDALVTDIRDKYLLERWRRQDSPAGDIAPPPEPAPLAVEHAMDLLQSTGHASHIGLLDGLTQYARDDAESSRAASGLSEVALPGEEVAVQTLREWMASWPDAEYVMTAFIDWAEDWQKELEGTNLDYPLDFRTAFLLHLEDLPEPPASVPEPGQPGFDPGLGGPEIDTLITEGIEVLGEFARALREDPRLLTAAYESSLATETYFAMEEFKQHAEALDLSPDSPQYKAALREFMTDAIKQVDPLFGLRAGDYPDIVAVIQAEHLARWRQRYQTPGGFM